jgi:hypothetical protein
MEFSSDTLAIFLVTSDPKLIAPLSTLLRDVAKERGTPRELRPR